MLKDYSTEMERVRMARIDFQDLALSLSRPGDITGLVQTFCLGETLLEPGVPGRHCARCRPRRSGEPT
jgi:hypothetical protein